MRADRPSTTAQIVALGVSCVASDPKRGRLAAPLDPDLGRRWVAGISPLTRLAASATQVSAGRLAARVLESALVPGITLHFVLRKRYLDDVTRQAIAEGFRQVIVIGAGFDTLAFRLHRVNPDVRFVEIDHPATQAFKRLRHGTSEAPRNNLTLIAADLAQQPLSGLLADRPRDDPSPTLFVAEGLLMYLTEQQVMATFEAVHGFEAPRVRFAFTSMERRPDGAVGFRREGALLKHLLRRGGEPFQWGIGPDDLDGFVASRGFHLLTRAAADEVHRHYLAPTDLRSLSAAQGEFVAVVERT